MQTGPGCPHTRGEQWLVCMGGGYQDFEVVELDGETQLGFEQVSVFIGGGIGSMLEAVVDALEERVGELFLFLFQVKHSAQLETEAGQLRSARTVGHSVMSCGMPKAHAKAARRTSSRSIQRKSEIAHPGSDQRETARPQACTLDSLVPKSSLSTLMLEQSTLSLQPRNPKP
eukprot:2926968-Rhodomonas_salina.2